MNGIYETREAAAQNTSEAVLQVQGGYITCGWDEALRRIREEAEELHMRGWKAKDRDTLMIAYEYDLEHAESLCAELSEIENAD